VKQRRGEKKRGSLRERGDSERLVLFKPACRMALPYSFVTEQRPEGHASPGGQARRASVWSHQAGRSLWRAIRCLPLSISPPFPSPSPPPPPLRPSPFPSALPHNPNEPAPAAACPGWLTARRFGGLAIEGQQAAEEVPSGRRRRGVVHRSLGGLPVLRVGACLLGAWCLLWCWLLAACLLLLAARFCAPAGMLLVLLIAQLGRSVPSQPFLVRRRSPLLASGLLLRCLLLDCFRRAQTRESIRRYLNGSMLLRRASWEWLLLSDAPADGTAWHAPLARLSQLVRPARPPSRLPASLTT